MKKLILAAILAAGMLSASTDFSSMSTEDLVGLRGSVATEEQEAFKAELQSRVSSMTTEEREALGIAPGANSSGSSYGTTARDGSAVGSMGASAGGFGSGMGGGSSSGGHGKGGMR